MPNRVRTVTTVTLFAVAIALLAFVAGRGGGSGLVKLPVASLGSDEADDAPASAMAARSSLMAPDFGGLEYRVVGSLGDLPSEAAAYRLGSEASAADVARLARALELEGEVREVSGAWTVRDGDRELRVERVPGLPWYLGTTCEQPAGPDTPVSSDTTITSAGCEVVVASGTEVVPDSAVQGCKEGPEGCAAPPALPAPTARPVPTSAPGPVPCPPDAACDPPTTAALPECPPGADCANVSTPPAPCPPGARCTAEPAVPVTTIPCDAGAGACPALTQPAPVPYPVPERPARPADLPSQADAERIARETFTRMGVALDGFAMEDGWLTWEARIEPRFDGMPVLGLGWWLGVGSGGRIVHANGFLATPERIGDYPLVGVETGLRRLNEGYGGFSAVSAERSGTDEAVVNAPAEPELTAEAEAAAAAELRAAEERKLALVGQAGGGQSAGASGSGGAEPAVDLPSPVVDCTDPTVKCDPSVPPMTLVPEPRPAPMPVPEKILLDVTGVRLVLLHLAGVLAPSYVFELADGGESPPVPAVTDEWLDREGRSTTPKG